MIFYDKVVFMVFDNHEALTAAGLRSNPDTVG